MSDTQTPTPATPDEAGPAGAVPHDYAVLSSREIYRGRVFGLRSDEVRMPGGVTAVREVVFHPGAVVIAAVDEADRVVLVRQFRHPVRQHLWELPAGLLDVDGEHAHEAAARELYEEAHLRADRWHVLADLFSSPGMTDEAVRVYLARDLTPVPEAERYRPEGDEEVEMTVERVDLDEAARRAFAGRLHNAATVAGVLAAARARDLGWDPAVLRPADAPWPAKTAAAGS